ncbi:energy-coupling factor ABC transporter permease [Palaeococcus ferrophilus]|uniref:energy-coupling factor ABC transporter permease n=1 Tax=Palaeococcus ferrophilus TaxID=83868 RepID=UPI00064E9A5A|nr:energy-coupling factor ABC transporter permease [Palaeococcus ferrophilus]
MHIPDGLLSLPVALATYAITVAVVAYSLRKLRDFPEERIPLLGLLGAGVFAAQMVNFPIVGGVSGHLLGAVLLSVLVGPYAAVVVMSAVLLVQTLLFGDGGVTAIGANILNMGILGAFLGYWVYTRLKRVNELLAIGAASWLAVVLGAALASVEIGLSHSIPFTKVLTLMVGYHALIGVGEAVITLFVVNALRAKLPEVGGVPA